MHHSFGRAHEKVVRVPERGVRLERSSRWPRTGGIRRWDCQWYGVGDGPVKRRAAGSASGAEETRTPDVLLAKEVLYQLSYVPSAPDGWWAFLDSNQRPLPYQGSALTS